MPSASVYDMDGQIVREENLDPYVFGAPVNVALLHQVVTAQLVNRRQGTASTKTRGQVSGGSRKPYKQKGTGRARQGSIRAPHYRGGGTVFGPHPHPYERAIPRKMKRVAIRSALSDKAANNRILLMDQLTFEEPRTRAMEQFLDKLPIERRLLVLMSQRDENVLLSAHNIRRVKMGHVDATNVVELMTFDTLLLPLESARKLVALYGREADDALQMKRHPRVVTRRKAREAAAAARATRHTTAATSAGAQGPAAATPGAETPARTETPAATASAASVPEAAASAPAAPRPRTRTRTPRVTGGTPPRVPQSETEE